MDESPKKGEEETFASSRPVSRPLQSGGGCEANVIHLDDDDEKKKKEPAQQADLIQNERERRIAALKAEILALESMQQKLQSSGWGALGCLRIKGETQSCLNCCLVGLCF